MNAQTFSPYSDFQAMTPTQLRSLQVKLTYIGPVEEPIKSLAFTTSFQALDMGAFVPFRRPGISYAGDDLPPRTFNATVEELQAMLQRVSELPAVTSGTADPVPYVSFSMVNEADGAKGFEAVLNPADSTQVVQRLRDAIAENAAGLQALNQFACETAIRDSTVPGDVTSSVSVTLSGVRLNRNTGRYVGTGTITNISAQALSGPISLVLAITNNVTLLNAVGYTCGAPPVGQPFIDVPLRNNQLQPGDAAQVNLEYANPSRVVITAKPRVLSGPGTR